MSASFLFETPWLYLSVAIIVVLSIILLTMIFKCTYYFKKACIFCGNTNSNV